MADHNQPVIIIRKKKRGGHAGHHGGAWKVAYADFVTAMMAFFLLMWLLNVTTSDQRKGIADYFSPMAISKSEGGSGGVMGGMSITSPTGAEISDSSPPGMEDRSTATAGKGDQGEEDVTGKSDTPPTNEELNAALQDKATKDAVALAKAMKKEEEKFKEAESSLMRAILETPGMQDLAQHLIIDRTPEGLRIQIIDRDKFSLFPSGSSSPYERGRDLLRLVGKVISFLPNRISVTGHTDSSPFAAGSRRDNWDLSTDRANVSRTELEVSGVPDHRVARVVGLADRDPFVPEDPKDSRNRRISIVLLRQIPRAEEALAAPPVPVSEPVKEKSP
ncbi:MAG: flagellar motor protein MotB [Alphaproteobacteria bacterium]|nr:flagellar motor protein MotB [Alphaproteobacteria bacterium]